MDLRFVEQLIDSEQTNTLAQMLRYCVEHQLLERYTLKDTVSMLLKEIQKGGLAAVGDSSYAPAAFPCPESRRFSPALTDTAISFCHQP